jgi:hypothetical protein
LKLNDISLIDGVPKVFNHERGLDGAETLDRDALCGILEHMITQGSAAGPVRSVDRSFIAALRRGGSPRGIEQALETACWDEVFSVTADVAVRIAQATRLAWGPAMKAEYMRPRETSRGEKPKSGQRMSFSSGGSPPAPPRPQAVTPALAGRRLFGRPVDEGDLARSLSAHGYALVKGLVSKGGFGEIHLAIAEGGVECAVKITSMKSGIPEQVIMKRVFHPHVLRCKASWMIDLELSGSREATRAPTFGEVVPPPASRVSIVTENAFLIDGSADISNRGPMMLSVALCVARQAGSALVHVKVAGYVHGDFTWNNVVLMSK